ncbi:PREDICTED: probable ribonuclease ZC3H12D isoform X3 [Dinoponera quadriceps]|uniref:Probable ribonuclease ZC3H12D isoform X3 n=1 Tax=Dinoponera quadriceps TaxID=609295 RepID=A0A6P3WQ55_DINQU|nr:PREDICTED: probable ribonuclease ZC3H12D isoform X3 [Dinoponera quadriceps]
MDDDDDALPSAATCHIRVAHRHVEPLRGRAAERIGQLFGVKLLLPSSNRPGEVRASTEASPLLRCYSPRGSNASEPLLVPLRILSADGGRGGSQPADTMCEIAVRVQRYVDCTVLGAGSVPDAEDSSYDSDYEAEDSTAATTATTATATVPRPRSESQVSSVAHQDVSRTASDTLAAEFAEYVTIQGPSPTQSPDLVRPGYTARVEFALKLGYTEKLVQAALQKLGPDPGQNELLAELIKLGATCSPRLSDGPEEADGLLDIEMGTDEGGGSILTSTTAMTMNTTSSAGLRPVVIDGSNVAMSHGNKEVFSCRGIKICVDWFRARGHKEITVFVPKWRKEASRPDNPVADQEILGELERDRLLVFTPSRLVGGKRMVCYDDRYILRLAAEVDGIVVSNDNYRDLAQENPEFRRVVEERILMYSFVNDRFMPPDDPLGRSGPTLENFLRIAPRKVDPAPPCPYAKKCTYGNKCKFRHPERGPHPHKSVTERLVEHAQRHLQARGPSLSLPLPSTTSVSPQHPPLCKTRSSVPPSVVQTLSSVPKSRSVENVTSDLSATSPAMYSQQMPSTPSPQSWAASRVSNPEPEPANMHRKLQRQLTLNPACDPRLYQLRRYHQQQASQPPQQQQQQQPVINSPRSSMQHRPLTRHASNESSYPVTAMSWDHTERLQHHHQHVTRIASAPDSYRAWPPCGAALVPPSRVQRLGTSDPQLNLLPSPPSASLHVPWGTQAQDARRRLHYHLANIFPEEQSFRGGTLYAVERSSCGIYKYVVTCTVSAIAIASRMPIGRVVKRSNLISRNIHLKFPNLVIREIRRVFVLLVVVGQHFADGERAGEQPAVT